MKLAAQTRTVFGKKVASLRKEGWVPGEVYGHGVDNMHVSVMHKDLAKAIQETGHTGIIMLGIEGKEQRVLAHDWTTDAHTGSIQHVDFHAVKAGEKITAAVQIAFEGEAPAVKEGLGTLVKNAHEVEVSGLPERIPQELVVDLSGLAELGASIHASDLKVPAGVELLTAADAVIASIGAIQEDVEPEAGMTVEDVAVEGEKKDSEESAS